MLSPRLQPARSSLQLSAVRKRVTPHLDKHMWQSLGFTASPYDAKPLRAVADDVELLVGREEEAVRFCTVIDSAPQGIYVMSGTPGVGKTSFLNVQQYLLQAGEAPFGPRLLAATQLCPIYPLDEPRAVALRAVHSLHRSVEFYCSQNGKKVPKQTKRLGEWVNRKGGSGFDVGLDIMGFGGSFGRQVEVPSVTEASFENLADVIACIVSDIVQELDLAGAFIVLDNIENLSDEQLSDMLITFRDTLFMIPNIWWVVIGQSGLGSLLHALDQRVSDRVASTALELEPITLPELEEAIQRRVLRFRSVPSGKAPLPTELHDLLYRSSSGEIRFVFKYSNAVCTEFVTRIRAQVAQLARDSKTKLRPEHMDEALGNILVDQLIPVALAKDILRNIVRAEFDGLHLKPKEKLVLSKIHELGSARPSDYKVFGLKTMQDFSSNYLSKLHNSNLLTRRQEGRAVFYSLRGIAIMAAEFGLIDMNADKADAADD